MNDTIDNIRLNGPFYSLAFVRVLVHNNILVNIYYMQFLCSFP